MASAFSFALSHFTKFGPATLKRLHTQLGNAEAIWHATPDDLRAAQVTEQTAAAFLTWRQTQKPAELAAKVSSLGIQVTTINDATYPSLLKTIYDPPALLYFRGTLPNPQGLYLGIVGSRRATNYGLQVAHDLAREVAAQNIVVVSGLAQGIDEAAHQGALEAKGKTVAVLAHGLAGGDSFRKERLASRIVDEGGAVVTEFPPFTPPLKQHFPIRNRIIAGMSQATLVVEAGDPSGSLITARAALDEGRDLLAVPGPITSPASAGTNRLCKEGAHVVTNAQDIFTLYGIVIGPPTEKVIPASLSTNERRIIELLTRQPQHIDEIVRTSQLSPEIVASALTSLEIQGLARNIGGMQYIR